MLRPDTPLPRIPQPEDPPSGMGAADKCHDGSKPSPEDCRWNARRCLVESFSGIPVNIPDIPENPA